MSHKYLIPGITHVLQAILSQPVYMYSFRKVRTIIWKFWIITDMYRHNVNLDGSVLAYLIFVEQFLLLDVFFPQGYTLGYRRKCAKTHKNSSVDICGLKFRKCVSIIVWFAHNWFKLILMFHQVLVFYPQGMK